MDPPLLAKHTGFSVNTFHKKLLPANLSSEELSAVEEVHVPVLMMGVKHRIGLSSEVQKFGARLDGVLLSDVGKTSPTKSTTTTSHRSAGSTIIMHLLWIPADIREGQRQFFHR